MRFGTAAIAIFLILPCLVKADDDPELNRPSLHGLKQLRVSVRRASTDSTFGFLSNDDIQTAVEAKLRVAGLPVTESTNILEHEGAFLSVSLTVVHQIGDDSALAYHLSLEVEQPVRLVRNAAITVPLAVTWSFGTTGFIGRERLRSIREELNDITDKFINAYLAENPVHR